MKSLILFTVGISLLLSCNVSRGEGVPLVYTYQPRDTAPVEGAILNGKPIQIDEGANWQITMDAGRLREQTESDIVLQVEGKREFITHCTTTPEICAGQSATVSPDAEYIVIQKSNGNLLREIGVMYTQAVIKDKKFGTVSSELWAYHVPTKKLTKMTEGYHDMTPNFCGDKLLWSSNRRGTYIPYTYDSGNPYPHQVQQIHSADFVDGKLENIVNLTPHEFIALSPECLDNGQILYTSYQGYSKRGEYQFTSTPQNLWWIAIMDGNGANALTIFALGAHNSPYIPSVETIPDVVGEVNQKVSSMLILRPPRMIAIRKDGSVLVMLGNYYRTNHPPGLGDLLCFTPSEVEGVSIRDNWPFRQTGSDKVGSGQFVPRDLRSCTPWGHGFDAEINYDQSKPPRALGKAGYPAPYVGPYFIYTWGKGANYLPVLSQGGDMATLKKMGGEPTAQKVICKSKIGVVRNPFTDCEIIAGDWDSNVWDARAVVPYEKLFGRSKAPAPPPPLPTIGGSELRVVNFNAMELDGIPSYMGRSNEFKKRVLLQGNAVPDVKARMDTFCVDEIVEWNTLPTKRGYKVRKLLKCQKPLDDGSIRMEVPHDTLFVMYGVDSQFKVPASGKVRWQDCINVVHDMCVTAEDLVVHSLRKGEKRTCHGCHDAHGWERMAMYYLEWEELYPNEAIIKAKFAEQRFSKTLSQPEGLPPGC